MLLCRKKKFRFDACYTGEIRLFLKIKNLFAKFFLVFIFLKYAISVISKLSLNSSKLVIFSICKKRFFFIISTRGQHLFNIFGNRNFHICRNFTFYEDCSYFE